ncbi:hypothetical protein HanRHA438_Chr12g0559211 [Helianthus annuus]|uniref:Uncharacterized protein n=1 Tax=Helianthus annuus TaxID=4232 RepID=A0A251T4Y3_HELAN|nr:hypothetical protein HanXRQr2_Chr12g0547801 [Helianthus annuus]KAJ0489867.1 hypothetical protein HanHA300_Chr12g0448831 [Helianthus annuus]KAJ0493877.1 hypothetical protein HanIR_Chr12g0591031 [Helianthus annuus]KAJ0505778.1 hypothetical protein HanHA89_Chr12g0474311 [Helianthus annuus]KAJ0675448.1 hypothetical protein HanLR1_Chr12g0451261 [Helianthus annuus]
MLLHESRPFESCLFLFSLVLGFLRKHDAGDCGCTQHSAKATCTPFLIVFSRICC